MAGYATDMLAQRDARIRQLENDLGSLARTCEKRAESDRTSASESALCTWVATQIKKALNPEDYEVTD